MLGDAYSHSREVSYRAGYRTETRTLGDENFEEQVPIWGHKDACFPAFRGHVATAVTKGCWGSEPDAIGRHPKLYKQYVEDLYSILCALRPNAPREQKGFAIENLFSLANGDLARSPIVSAGGYGYRFTEEAESLRGLFNKTQLIDPEKALILRPELHEVRSPFTTWGALHGDPNTVIEGVMGLSY